MFDKYIDMREAVRESGLPVLKALSMLPSLSRKPAVRGARNGQRDYCYHKLVHWNPKVRRRQELYLGRPSRAELEMLNNEIENHWPNPGRWIRKRIVKLGERRRDVEVLAKVAGVAAGYGFQGHLVMKRRKRI